jgi:hypothetical protein
MEKLKLEVNPKFIDGDENIINLLGVTAMITPNLDEDYWQFRVRVHEDQEIVGFPKFMTIGIGFAKEDDWNTNLPYNCNTEEIFNHIKHNKRYASIPDETCIKAIKMIQKAAKKMKDVEKEMEDIVVFENEPMLKDENTGKFLSKKEFKERCDISRRRRADTFTAIWDENKTPIKKYKFVILFGYHGKYPRYKYRFSGYFKTQAQAMNRFMYVLRNQNLYGRFQQQQFERLDIAEDVENRGFKIPIVI